MLPDHWAKCCAWHPLHSAGSWSSAVVSPFEDDTGAAELS